MIVGSLSYNTRCLEVTVVVICTTQIKLIEFNVNDKLRGTAMCQQQARPALKYNLKYVIFDSNGDH